MLYLDDLLGLCLLYFFMWLAYLYLRFELSPYTVTVWKKLYLYPDKHSSMVWFLDFFCIFLYLLYFVQFCCITLIFFIDLCPLFFSFFLFCGACSSWNRKILYVYDIIQIWIYLSVLQVHLWVHVQVFLRMFCSCHTRVTVAGHVVNCHLPKPYAMLANVSF